MEAAGSCGGDNPEECPVCLTAFDDLLQRPRTLPCGHTVCTLCTDKLKEQGRVTCVECRSTHAVPEGGQFPICYIAEAFVRKMRDARVAPAAAAGLQPPCAGKEKVVAGAAGKKGAAGLSKKMRSFLQEQQASVVAAITACQEARSQLQQYRETLTGWREQQQQLEDRLQALVDQSRDARVHLQQEESRAAAEEEEVTRREQELQVVQEALHTPATEQEADVDVAAVFSCLEEAEQEMEKCHECFPNAHTITAARKVREASSAALEAAQAVQAGLEAPAPGAAEEPQPQPDPIELQSQPQSQPQPAPGSTIMERLQLILRVNLTTMDICRVTQPVLSLLQAGQVFAVQQVEGQRQHSRISLEAGRLYLHALKEQPPPEGAATLQMSKVVPPSPRLHGVPGPVLAGHFTKRDINPPEPQHPTWQTVHHSVHGAARPFLPGHVLARHFTTIDVNLPEPRHPTSQTVHHSVHGAARPFLPGHVLAGHFTKRDINPPEPRHPTRQTVHHSVDEAARPFLPELWIVHGV